MTRSGSNGVRRGPVEGEHVIGVDADPGRRPGTPMAAPPTLRAPSRKLVRQQDPPKPFHRAALDRPTAVYGTAQPPRGASGLLRKTAYGIPEHFARHWMLLLLADRVDALEDRAATLLAGPLESAGLTGAAGVARRNPLPVLAGLVLGAWAAQRLAR